MTELNKTKKKVIVGSVLLFGIASIISVIFAKEPLKMIYGIMTGLAIGLLGFLELANTMLKAVTMNPVKAKRYAGLKYALRFIIMAAALALSALSPVVNFYGTAIGLILIKIVIYLLHIFDSSDYYKNIISKKDYKDTVLKEIIEEEESKDF